MKVSQLLENPIGARAPIYHWTEWLSLKGILQHGGVGQHDWSVSGVTNLKDGWVSFTRDRNYRIRGNKSDVRLTFDYTKLRQKGYKIRPYVDRFVVKSTRDDDFMKQDEARWEAEELVLGPVMLKDGLIKIEITKACFDEQQELIKRFRNNIETAEEIIRQLDDGTFRWSVDFWRGQDPNHQRGFETFIKNSTAELEKNPRWLPKNFEERQHGIVQTYTKYIKEIEDILSHVEVMGKF